MPLVDRVADGLADEVRADREAAEPVLLEQLPLRVDVAVVRERRVDVEVVAPAGELEAVEAPAAAFSASSSSGRSAHWPVKSVTGRAMSLSLLSRWPGCRRPRPRSGSRRRPRTRGPSREASRRRRSTRRAPPGGAIVSSADRPTFVESIEATVRWDEAIAACSVSASARRVVVRPCSSVTPAADTNAVSMLSPARNSADQRPPIMRSVWSTSPGTTTMWICCACSSSAIAGEFVTSVSERGGSRSRRRASDEVRRRRVEEHRRAVLDELGRAGGDRLLLRQRLPQPLRPVGGHLDVRRRAAGGRAPPRTRSIRPSAARRSRSRCTVIDETPWSRASSATDAPPSRWMRSRILDRRMSAGTAQPAAGAETRAR